MNSKYSLKQPHYFDKVINGGIKIRSQYFLISFVKADDFKIGISVPKRLGNAVFRNRNKRVIKNIIPNINVFDKKVHIVLIVKEPFIDLSFDDKTNVLKNELNRIRNNG